jgi:DNA-directed RNA polymerase subunit H (RpoH/RPB5)
MYQTKHNFHLIDPSLKSARLLHDWEKDPIIHKFKLEGLHLYSISIKDWRCVAMNAKINDIICFRNHLTNVYRIVI